MEPQSDGPDPCAVHDRRALVRAMHRMLPLSEAIVSAHNDLRDLDVAMEAAQAIRAQLRRLTAEYTNEEGDPK